MPRDLFQVLTPSRHEGVVQPFLIPMSGTHGAIPTPPIFPNVTLRLWSVEQWRFWVKRQRIGKVKGYGATIGPGALPGTVPWAKTELSSIPSSRSTCTNCWDLKFPSFSPSTRSILCVFFVILGYRFPKQHELVKTLLLWDVTHHVAVVFFTDVSLFRNVGRKLPLHAA